MGTPEVMTALRTGAAVTRAAHVSALRLTGPGAQDLLDAATTSRLFVREGQMLQTLMLDAAARVFADVCVCLDEDAWLVLAEGPTPAELMAHLDRVRTSRVPTADVAVTDLTAANELWSIDGPFAWEVTSALLGPQVLGAPYLSFLRLQDVTCFRLGKTGEYGYLLLVPSVVARSLWDELLSLGAGFGLVEADLAALDQCALENWHLTMRALRHAPAGQPLTPLELQLQWRMDLEKDYEGAPAYRAHRQAGPRTRVTCFVAGRPVRPGEPVRFGERTIGAVLASGWSTVRGDCVGWALLDVELAWPGIRRFHVASAEGAVPIETRSPPLLDNRSLLVDPHRHTFRARDEHAFPPLVSR